MSSSTKILIHQVNVYGHSMSSVVRVNTDTPELFMKADMLNYEGKKHPVIRRELTLDEHFNIEYITLIIN